MARWCLMSQNFQVLNFQVLSSIEDAAASAQSDNSWIPTNALYRFFLYLIVYFIFVFSVSLANKIINGLARVIVTITLSTVICCS